METLKNEFLEIAVSAHGAELCSILCSGQEYLWNADPQYWKRHSPVLFPIVGSVWDGTFRVNGRSYKMSQHGFARDMDFTPVSKTADSIVYALESNEETLEKYPFPFRLEIGYRIEGKSVYVGWKVINTGAGPLPFQIGAHPAFYYPDFNPDSPDRGSFTLEGSDDLEYILIGSKGCADISKRHPCGRNIQITPSLFDADALIFDRSQVKKVTLNAPDGRPWLALAFNAPLVGLWSPVGKNAPFVCIEPWWGRCDRVGYKGDFIDRDEVNILVPRESFSVSYQIEIL